MCEHLRGGDALQRHEVAVERLPRVDLVVGEPGLAEKVVGRGLLHIDNDVFEVPLDRLRKRVNRLFDDRHELFH